MTDHGGVSAARIDYEHHQFIARDGTVLTMKPIPKLLLERLYNSQEGKPKVPVVEVMIAGQFPRKESNPEDPDYKQALEEWQTAKNLRIVRFVIINGIVDPAPDCFVRENSEFFPDETEGGMKYLWIVSLLGSEGEDLQLLSEALMSQTAVTEKGVELASNSFPGDGGGNPVATVPDAESAD